MTTLLRITLCLLITLFSFVSEANEPSKYEDLMTKAKRFADWKEWRSAAAMYQLAAKQDPSATEAYAPALIIYGMLDETDEVKELLTTALRSGIPPDSLFDATRSAAVKLAHLNRYEQFLLTARRSVPYLTRTINDRLLDYYAFRNDGAKMVEYAELMLTSDMPAKYQVPYLTRAAMGYIDMGRTTEAIHYFKQILDIDTKNLNALLYLGNFYAQSGDMNTALPYLTRAQEIRPSLYLAKLIEQAHTAT